MVFFVKDRLGRYTRADLSLVAPAGSEASRGGDRAQCDGFSPATLDGVYVLRNRRVLQDGEVIENQLELHIDIVPVFEAFKLGASQGVN